MKVSKIKTLRLSNFKGIANGEFAFNDGKNEFIADVMQGKSTLKEGFLWVLGMEVDNFYPIGKDNKPIEGLETTVALVLDVDGLEFLLSRSAKMKYKNKQFDGYKKDNFSFDGVPCKATDYKAKVCGLLGVENFDTLKYLTVLNHFNEGVHWKERRSLVYDLFVNPTKIDALNGNPKYNLIANDLAKGKSSVDILATLNNDAKDLAKRKQRNEILLEDKKAEASTFENLNYESIQTELESVEKQIDEEQKRLNAVNSQNTRKALETEIATKSNLLSRLATSDFIAKSALESKRMRTEELLREIKNTADFIAKEIERLKANYNDLKMTKFDERETICPTCHQTLPQAKIDELVENWSKNKREQLSRLKTRILSRQDDLREQEERHARQSDELNSLSEFAPDPKIAELEVELSELKARLDVAHDETVETSTIDGLKDMRNFLLCELGKRDSFLKLTEKIATLQNERQLLENEEIAIAKKRLQLEQYTLDFIGTVDLSINENFDGVKFKLFEELTATANNSIKETLVCLHNGVDYVSQSTGEKAISNCTIVSTLQKKLGVSLPIWLDDASILNLKNEPNTQLIYLLNEKGKELECVKIKDLY